MQDKDMNTDNTLKNGERLNFRAGEYAENLSTQLRKGLLSYCVLLICRNEVYTSEILRGLKEAEVAVAEGTIYPLLARLQKDDLLSYQWRESEQGPPRKYYVVTEYGQAVRQRLASSIKELNSSITKLERSKNERNK
ncbi:PadR family transcriptional regulator [Candidatus Saccharibacteria bacterium]|jgi:PadR family transcriptional regulator PadR|nr:PadR family transcriptional regulator [Candidatus Saccharibacteria bacterium]